MKKLPAIFLFGALLASSPALASVGGPPLLFALTFFIIIAISVIGFMYQLFRILRRWITEKKKPSWRQLLVLWFFLISPFTPYFYLTISEYISRM